ncbi:helix-turn-helix domain-containing protein [uncultured Cohaesibacter sp.]|uniref:TetR/AcrR family transcriptional regulator n=1 Tax=uncultured Cohaesibacter sp. TaxID=1002546 RepID=UPI002AAB4C40|nr:helix-turn-helix domain-containing protein [uncultured Cohaesibacter sp.]
MTSTKDKVIQAAHELISRYGYNRTSMTDVAKQAGLSRQTVYAVFANKEDLFAETSYHVFHERLNKTREEITHCTSLGDQLNTYFENMVVQPFIFLQNHPEAITLWNDADMNNHPAIAKLKHEHRQFLAELLVPYTKYIGASGQCPAHMADFIIMTCREMKCGKADSIEELHRLLDTLSASILALTSQGGAEAA